MRYWLLQANPKTWDIDRFLRDGHELRSFIVVNHVREIEAGDRFLLWKSGSGGGVVGEGQVIGSPRLASISDGDEYWLKNPPGSDAQEIPLRMTDLWIDDPLPRNALLDDPVLSQSSIIKAPQSGNPFSLTQEQWNRIQVLLARATPESSPADWRLSPGDQIKRTDLHAQYGGSGQNGITRSASTPNVLIFTDPASGNQHGYFDEWGEDGFFYYSGEGQRGDQTLTGGNKAILEATGQTRSLRVFKGAKGTVEYIGEFRLDKQTPYIEVQAPETAGGPTRRVYQFRLWPLDLPGGASPTSGKPIGSPYTPKPDDIDVSPRTTPRSADPDAYGRGLRQHRKTERELADMIKVQGHTPLQPSPSDPPFDVAWYTDDNEVTIVEVKSITRLNESKQMRLGIGQILDYAETMRLRGLVVTSVLHLSHEPRDQRWSSICDRAGIRLTWAEQTEGRD